MKHIQPWLAVIIKKASCLAILLSLVSCASYTPTKAAGSKMTLFQAKGTVKHILKHAASCCGGHSITKVDKVIISKKQIELVSAGHENLVLDITNLNPVVTEDFTVRTNGMINFNWVNLPTANDAIQLADALAVIKNHQSELSDSGADDFDEDSAQALKMSLREASIIVKNNSVVDFLPSEIMIGSDPTIVSCRYEDMDPIIYEEKGKNIVDFGSQCHYRLAFPADKNAEAQLVATALLRWKMATSEERQAWDDQLFVNSAMDYRASNPKPRLPEEARKFRVQAEFAVQEKQFDKGVELYGKALEIAPWWPEGHYNRALILGETKIYRDAIREMKRYLLLVPDAPDSRKVQDKIYQWEGMVGP